MPGCEPDAGRAARFGQLLKPSLPRLLAGARLLTGDHHLAEDVLQTALLGAFQTYDPAVHDERFHARTWRFVANTALDARRKEAIRSAVEREARITAADLALELRNSEAHEHVLEDPERFLEEADDAIRQAVLGLPEVERWVFLLRAMGDFKYREIAGILDAPVGSVMTWLHRARQRLRAVLASRTESEGRKP